MPATWRRLESKPTPSRAPRPMSAAWRFSSAALAIEQAARSGSLAELPQLLVELERQFQLLQQLMQENEDENTAG